MCPNSTNSITLVPSYYPSYTILTHPTNGVLTGTAPYLYYTPNPCFEGGQDSFTYKANDGTNDSAPATVTITVNADAVYANPVSALVFRSDPASFTLSGEDSCGETLGYAPLFQPAHGTLTGTAPNLNYTSTVTNFSGTDSFDYVVFNVCGDAATNTVTLQYVDGPILLHDCNPFGTAVKLDWTLDANDQQENLNINDYIIYRSTNSDTNFTAIATKYQQFQ